MAALLEFVLGTGFVLVVFQLADYTAGCVAHRLGNENLAHFFLYENGKSFPSQLAWAMGCSAAMVVLI